MTEVTRDFTVATFVIHDGKVLLLWHKKLSMWLPPGGHIDPHELPDHAAVREVKEETGLDVVLLSQPATPPLSGVRPLARPESIQLEVISPGHEHIDLVYFARPADPTAVRPVANHEVENVGWYGLADMDKVELTEEIQYWVKRALASVG